MNRDIDTAVAKPRLGRPGRPAALPYQALTDVLVHALTNGFFWLSAWLMAGGCALVVGILLPLARVLQAGVPIADAAMDGNDEATARS